MPDEDAHARIEEADEDVHRRVSGGDEVAEAEQPQMFVVDDALNGLGAVGGDTVRARRLDEFGWGRWIHAGRAMVLPARLKIRFILQAAPGRNKSPLAGARPEPNVPTS